MVMSSGSTAGTLLTTTNVTTRPRTAAIATLPSAIPIRRLRLSAACCFLRAATLAARRSSLCCLTVSSFRCAGGMGFDPVGREGKAGVLSVERRGAIKHGGTGWVEYGNSWSELSCRRSDLQSNILPALVGSLRRSRACHHPFSGEQGLASEVRELHHRHR